MPDENVQQHTQANMKMLSWKHVNFRNKSPFVKISSHCACLVSFKCQTLGFLSSRNLWKVMYYF